MSPQPIRAPRAPSPTPSRPIRPVRLSPIRSPGSTDLDARTVKPRGQPESLVPPYRPWSEAMAYLREHWHPGQHMALVARTRSGKTTAARRMLTLRDWVLVLGTKPRDPD